MKKKVLLVAAVFTAAFFATEAQAQDYKPVAGDKTLEVNFIPFSAEPISKAGLKFRSFSSETSVFRIGVNLGYSSITTDTRAVANEEVEIDKESNLGISLTPGIEKHFAGTDRLSPYVGGVLEIGYSSKTITQQEYHIVNEAMYDTKTKTSQLDLGLSAVMGVDWYFTEKMYLGFEAGFGFVYSSLGDKKVSYDQPGFDDAEAERGNNFQIGTRVNTAFRLGYAF